MYKALWKGKLPDNQKSKFNPGVINTKIKFLSMPEFLFLQNQELKIMLFEVLLAL